MKYIGENSIKKLIALIKGDIAKKQDSITATGVLERDTAGAINGVETVGATLVETQEATLVDVPNGLLKGDGTSISVAVAGTDYAPGGFGLGSPVATIPANGNLNNYINTGFFGSASTDTISTWVNVPANWPANEAVLEVYSTISTYVIQRLSSVTTKVSAQRSLINNVWAEWEWVNPPIALGVEYRTTERYLNKPVYTMAFPFGALPNASDKVVAMPGTDSTCKIIEIHGYASNEMTLPGVSGTSTGSQVTLTGVGNRAYVITGSDRSSATATIVAKYIKTTD